MKPRLLHAALFTPTRKGWGLPVLFEGEPGVAKSAVIEEYAERLGLPCEVLSPGERGEGAFGVVPIPVKGVLTYPPPDWAGRMAGGGLVFVDEITTAPKLLQAPMLGLVAAKRIGSHQFGPRVRVLGACNPPELAANGNELSAPLANRFGWYAWEPPTVEEHATYMLSAASGQTAAPIDAAAEEARVLAAWGSAYARAAGLETSFLAAQPQWKNQCPKASDPAIARAWPSDRSWEMATRAYASAIVHDLTDVERDEFVTGFIGAKAYAAWATFIDAADLPDIAAFLDGKVKFEHDRRRLDRTAAVINAAAALVTTTTTARRDERAKALWSFLNTVPAADLIVPAAQALIRSDLHTSAEAVPALAKLNPVMKKSGMARK